MTTMLNSFVSLQYQREMSRLAMRTMLAFQLYIALTKM